MSQDFVVKFFVRSFCQAFVNFISEAFVKFILIEFQESQILTEKRAPYFLK